jgi:hypothetical protein
MKGILQGVASEPSPDAILWRYMSFSRFVAMLSQQGLYFRRSDAFPDRWEGAIGPASLKPLYDQRLNELMTEAIGGPQPDDVEPLTPEAKLKTASDLVLQMSELNRKLRLNTFISCWHEAADESEAMWKLYSYDSSEGIAIVTDCRTLKRLIPRKYAVTIGSVQYRDSDFGPSAPLHRFFHKRPAFAHEKEVRLVHIQNDVEPSADLGLVVPVELRKLIHHIVVSPYAPDWVFKVAEDVCKKYRFSTPIHRSHLADEPFHF